MEALLYLVGLSSYLNPEIEKSRHSLVNELKQKLHASARSTAPQYKDKRFDKEGKTLAFDTDLNEVVSLVRLAENPRTAPYILSTLAEHPNPEVRMAVADNESAPYSVQDDLAADEHVDVRFRVAENYHIKRVLLEQLADDENPYVSSRAEDTLSRLEAA